MPPPQGIGGSNNVVNQVERHGNTVVAVGRPLLTLTKHVPWRAVRTQDGQEVETDVLNAHTQSFAEGLKAISDHFQQLIHAFVCLSAALIVDHLRCAEAAGIETDSTVVAPIVEKLKATAVIGGD